MKKEKRFNKLKKEGLDYDKVSLKPVDINSALSIVYHSTAKG